MSTVLITGLVQFNSQPPIPLVTILSLGIRKLLCLTKSGQLIWESVSRCRSHWSMSRQNHLGKEARWSEARSATANWLRRFLLSGVGQDPLSSFRGESSYEGLPSPGKSPTATGSIFVGLLCLVGGQGESLGCFPSYVFIPCCCVACFARYPSSHPSCPGW